MVNSLQSTRATPSKLALTFSESSKKQPGREEAKKKGSGGKGKKEARERNRKERKRKITKKGKEHGEK